MLFKERLIIRFRSGPQVPLSLIQLQKIVMIIETFSKCKKKLIVNINKDSVIEIVTDDCDFRQNIDDIISSIHSIYNDIKIVKDYCEII